jgi:hypothetical protein
VIFDLIHGGLRGLRRLIAFTLKVVSAIVIVFVARLLWAPVSIPPLTPKLEALANAHFEQSEKSAIGIAAVAIKESFVWYDIETSRLKLGVSDVTFQDPKGEKVAEVTKASIRLDLWDLLGGKISVHSTEIIGADTVLVRTDEGQLRLGIFAQHPVSHKAAAAEAPEIEDSFEIAARIADGLSAERGAMPPFDAFEKLVFRELNLTYRDEMSGNIWHAPGASIDFQKQANGARASVEMAILRTEAPDETPVAVRLDGQWNFGSNIVDVFAEVRSAPIDMIVSQAPSFDTLSVLQGTVSGEFRARLDISDGELAELAVVISTDQSRIRLAENDFLPIERAAAAFVYDPTMDLLVVNEATITADGYNTAFSGEFALLRDREGQTSAARGAIKIGDTRIAKPSLFDPPLEVSSGTASFEIEAKGDVLHARIFDLAITGPMLELQGVAALASPGQGAQMADVSLTIGRLQATDLVKIWPKPLAPGGRMWIANNLSGGELQDLKINYRTNATEEDFRGTFAFRDLSGTYVSGMPAVTDGVGSVTATLDRFDLTFASAAVKAPNGAAIRLDDSAFSITDFAPDHPPAEVLLKTSGELADMAALLDSPPLNLLKKIDVKPSSFGGQIEGTTIMSFPLAKDLRLADIAIDSQANIRNLTLAKSAFDVSVVAKLASLHATVAGYELKAKKAIIDGRAASLNVTERFSPPKGQARRTARIGMRLSAKELEGLGAPEHLLEGSLFASLLIKDTDGQRKQFIGQANLKDLGLAIRPLDWVKKRGAAGQAKITGVIGPQGLRPQKFSVAMGNLVVDGATTFSSGTLSQIDLKSLKIKDKADLSVIISPEKNGWRIIGGGGFLDLRAAFRDQKQRKAPDSDAKNSGTQTVSATIDADLALDALLLLGSKPLPNARLVGRREATGDWTIEMRALAKQAVLFAGAKLTAAKDQISVRTDNAGHILGVLDLIADADGGVMTINAQGPSGGPYRGVIDIADIVLKSPPPILDAISKVLVVGWLDSMATGGMSFQRVRIPFHLKGETLEIRDGVATGPSIGMTIEGDYLRSEGQLKMSGSMSPAYAINGIISEVPIVGELLTGGSGEGLLGATFTLRGSVLDPDISVNPLSVLTPGFLRGIFSGGDFEAPAPQSGLRQSTQPERIE